MAILDMFTDDTSYHLRYELLQRDTYNASYQMNIIIFGNMPLLDYWYKYYSSKTIDALLLTTNSLVARVMH